MFRKLSLLLTLPLVLATPAAAQDTAPAAPATANDAMVDADPALWVLRDEDTTIYLFGTVHVLRPNLSWFDEAVRDAFNSADELRLELVMPKNPAEMAPIVWRYAIDPQGRTMTSRLTDAQRTAYTAGMDAIGVPAVAVDQFEPWMIGLTLSQVLVQRAGYDANAGAERVLTAAAEAAGKPVTGFETVEEQIQLLDSTPESEQIDSVLQTVARHTELAALFDTLVNSWAAGTPDVTGNLMNMALATTPETARILLTDRNRRWAESLAARMAEPGTLFVAVGAGHLTGDTSVQHFLAERGLTVSRVSY